MFGEVFTVKIFITCFNCTNVKEDFFFETGDVNFLSNNIISQVLYFKLNILHSTIGQHY